MTSPAIPEPLQTPSILFLRRVYGLVLRVFYLHAGSWQRLIEVFYWPTINMLVWGFTSLYVMREIGHVSVIIDVLLGGILLGEVLLRTEMGTMMLFMEEIWSRNLGHLFASPLRRADYVIGLFAMSFVRMIVAVSMAVVVARYLFHYSLLGLGWPLVPYVGLLVINGWWCGLLLISMLIRFGLASEWLAWMGGWVIIPFVAPYYPVSVLPKALQIVSYSLPGTYVFDSMKAQIAGHGLQSDDLLIALGLNVFYMFVAAWVFRRAYRAARIRGTLLQSGE